jgi:hypothetical protein
MRGIKVGFRDGTQHNSVVDASLPGRTTALHSKFGGKRNLP